MSYDKGTQDWQDEMRRATTALRVALWNEHPAILRKLTGASNGHL